jgi:hypothetical protein
VFGSLLSVFGSLAIISASLVFSRIVATKRGLLDPEFPARCADERALMDTAALTLVDTAALALMHSAPLEKKNILSKLAALRSLRHSPVALDSLIVQPPVARSGDEHPRPGRALPTWAEPGSIPAR